MARTKSARAPRSTASRAARPRAAAAEGGPSARERVLRAALEVFSDEGYEGAATTEIARRAGVTQPLVHYHFASKELLWEAAVADLFARLSALTDGAGDELRDLDAVSRLKVMLRRFVRFSATHPEVGRFLQREGIHDGPRLRWLVEHHGRPLSLAMRALLREAQAAGALKGLDASTLACLVISAGSSVFTVPALVRAQHGLDVCDAAVVERYADTLVEVMFHGAAASAEAPTVSAAREPTAARPGGSR